MKKSLYIFFLLTHFLNSANSQTKKEIDSLFTYGYGICYTWGTEHAGESICLLKDTNIYYHSFQEHLLGQSCYGIYEIFNDTLKLHCFLECIDDWKGIGSIVVPMNDNRFQDTVFIRTADNSATSLLGQISRDFINKKDLVVIYNNKSIFYSQEMDTIAQYYVVELPAYFVPYDSKIGNNKLGIIKNDVLFLDFKTYGKSEFHPNVEPKKRKYKTK